jgi:pyruvate dehydrogenase (quinone)
VSKPTVSDFLLDRLEAWGVRCIYGYAGDGINPILGALRRAGDRFQFVQTVHEEQAGLMACAHAKYSSGELGVCLSTQGPGAVHLLNGLYDAKLDHQPVLAILGQPASNALGGSSMQEIDLVTLLKDVAHEYVQVLSHPTQVRHAIDRAVRIALAERTVTALIFNHDLQRQEAVVEPPHKHGMQHSSLGYVRPLVVPPDGELRRAAAVLNAGKKVAILVGAGALDATDEVIEVAEALGAGVAKALLGKAAVPDDLPFVTGSVGWLGTAASNEMMVECDTLLMVGTGMPYTEFLPGEGQARAVQVDLAASMLGLRYPVEVGLVGDAKLTLRALLGLVERKADRAWRERIEGKVADWWREVERRARQPAEPINPQLVVWELSARLPDDAIVSGDSGSAAVWLARDLRLRRGVMASLSGTLATMGSGLTYALAAKTVHPGRPSIALVGDGAMQMAGLNSLITVAKYWREWRDPRLVTLVLNNRDLNYVTWEQRAMEGEPKYPASQDLLDLPYARFAELLGLRGIRVERPEQVGPAWDEALAADRPVVIDAVVDPDVPTLPPRLQEEQVAKLRQALAAGDPDREGAERQIAREGVMPA